jgi:DNA-binding protein HU-beta
MIAEDSHISFLEKRSAVWPVLHAQFSNKVPDGVNHQYMTVDCRFGTFTPRHRPARKARNPRTQEEMNIEATTVPAFSAGKAFKDKVKENGAV